MRRLAFIFPGQGSQVVGMGSDLYEAIPAARQRYDEAENILGFSLKEYSFEGPEDTLKQTYVTQPALFVHSVILADLLAERAFKPVVAAGHSLGEYSALYAAGAAGFKELLELVKVRGELMQHAGEKSPGTMAALLGADKETAEKLCEKASAAGVVMPANFNAPGQIVISGSVEGVHEAMKISRQFGIKRAMELNVSGAFHSPLMADATEGLVQKIDATSWNTAAIPVVANATAAEMTNPDLIRDNLKKQLLSAVMWSDSIRLMAQNGIDAFVEVGAGKVLQGLVKRIAKDIPCFNVSSAADLEQIKENLL